MAGRNDLGSLLRRSLETCRDHPIAFVSIAAPFLPLEVAAALARGPWHLVTSIGVLVVSQLPFAALVRAASVATHGGKPSFGDSYAAVLTRARDILEVTIRHLGATLLLTASLVGMPWGLNIFVRWFFGIQGVVLYSLTPKDALRFSSQIVKGSWWRTFMALLIPVTLGQIPVWVPVVLFRSFSPLVLVMSALVGVVLTPFLICFYTLWFFRLVDLRNGTENGELSAFQI